MGKIGIVKRQDRKNRYLSVCLTVLLQEIMWNRNRTVRITKSAQKERLFVTVFSCLSTDRTFPINTPSQRFHQLHNAEMSLHGIFMQRPTLLFLGLKLPLDNHTILVPHHFIITLLIYLLQLFLHLEREILLYELHCIQVQIA